MSASMHSINSSAAIQGQLLRVSKHRAVAIYLRDGYTWVADFVDGRGVLVDVDTWLRFNCGSLANPYALRRIALESAQPLPRELVAQIEDLHRLHESIRPRTRHALDGRRLGAASAQMNGDADGGPVSCAQVPAAQLVVILNATVQQPGEHHAFQRAATTGGIPFA